MDETPFIGQIMEFNLWMQLWFYFVDAFTNNLQLNLPIKSMSDSERDGVPLKL